MLLPRRQFLLVAAGGLVQLPWTSRGWAQSARSVSGGPHPHPRPGITAAKVLTAEQLAEWSHAAPVFDQVREIPAIVDGIRCQCGCADAPGFYSLLSCFESEGMARYCDICQGEARLAHRLHRAGESLDQIRAAIDARFG
jgi:hypothetical protein